MRKPIKDPKEITPGNSVVSSTEKALKILDCFSTSQPELSLTQISQRLNFPKSTTLNQIRTLERWGYLLKVKNTQNYRLGYKIMELNYCVHSTMPIVQCALPFMEELRSASGKNVYLTTHVDGQVLYLDALLTTKHRVAYSVAGRTLPMHCTSCGKAMLSFMSEAEVKRIVALRGLPAMTPNTCTNYEKLMEDLRISKERGYALDCEEESLGGKCVASAIRTAQGNVAGALSISGSSLSMTDDDICKYAKLLQDASHALTPYAHLFPAIEQTL